MAHFLQESRRWRLQVGDGLIGPEVVMTGREATERNKAMDRRYLRDLDAGKTVRLSRWISC